MKDRKPKIKKPKREPQPIRSMVPLLEDLIELLPEDAEKFLRAKKQRDSGLKP